jgi:hypothetical protein
VLDSAILLQSLCAWKHYFQGDLIGHTFLIEQISKGFHKSIQDSLSWLANGVAGGEERLAAPRTPSINEASSFAELRVRILKRKQSSVDL